MAGHGQVGTSILSHDCTYIDINILGDGLVDAAYGHDESDGRLLGQDGGGSQRWVQGMELLGQVQRAPLEL